MGEPLNNFVKFVSRILKICSMVLVVNAVMMEGALTASSESLLNASELFLAEKNVRAGSSPAPNVVLQDKVAEILHGVSGVGDNGAGSPTTVQPATNLVSSAVPDSSNPSTASIDSAVQQNDPNAASLPTSSSVNDSTSAPNQVPLPQNATVPPQNAAVLPQNATSTNPQQSNPSKVIDSQPSSQSSVGSQPSSQPSPIDPQQAVQSQQPAQNQQPSPIDPQQAVQSQQPVQNQQPSPIDPQQAVRSQQLVQSQPMQQQVNPPPSEQQPMQNAAQFTQTQNTLQQPTQNPPQPEMTQLSPSYPPQPSSPFYPQQPASAPMIPVNGQWYYRDQLFAPPPRPSSQQPPNDYYGYYYRTNPTDRNHLQAKRVHCFCEESEEKLAKRIEEAVNEQPKTRSWWEWLFGTSKKSDDSSTSAPGDASSSSIGASNTSPSWNSMPCAQRHPFVHPVHGPSPAWMNQLQARQGLFRYPQVYPRDLELPPPQLRISY